MIENILLSIIVPVFNTPSALLTACLSSICKQLLDNVEVIIVNDGSTKPECKAILTEYVKLDEKIQYKEQSNKGVSSARNTGIELAKGEYLMFVDADDTLATNSISYIIKRLKEYINNIDCLILGYSTNGLESSASLIQNKEIHSVNQDLRDQFIYDIFGRDTRKYNSQYHINIDSPWAKVFSSKIINEYKICFVEGLSRSEDALFCAEFYECASKILIDTSPIYHYNFNSESICRKCSPTIIQNLSSICENFEALNKKYYGERKDLTQQIGNMAGAYFMEAEERYFFNNLNAKPIFTLLREYQDFILDPVVNKYLKIRIHNIVSSLDRLKFWVRIYYTKSFYFLLRKIIFTI